MSRSVQGRGIQTHTSGLQRFHNLGKRREKEERSGEERGLASVRVVDSPYWLHEELLPGTHSVVKTGPFLTQKQSKLNKTNTHHVTHF